MSIRFAWPELRECNVTWVHGNLYNMPWTRDFFMKNELID